MLCQSMFVIAMRISIFQSLLFENEPYNIFLAFFDLCSWKFLSFSHELTLAIVGSTFQLTGRHDLIGSSRSVEIFAASQAVRLQAVKLTSFLQLHDPTSGESGRQQQLTTRLSSCSVQFMKQQLTARISSCILDMCVDGSFFLRAKFQNYGVNQSKTICFSPLFLRGGHRSGTRY